MLTRSKWVTALSLAGVMLFASGCDKLKSRDEMNKGVQAYRNNHYPDAVNHFKQAVELDPTNKNAKLYLATSYMVQWVPGADSSDNKKNYDMAQRTFNDVLKEEPTNPLALASLASMAFNSASSGTDDQKKAALDEAKRWNERRVEVDPKDAEAYYYLGVIDWSQAFPTLRSARSQEKLAADDPGPLKDAKVRADLKGKYWDTVQHGLDQLNKCLTYDKENEDAMSYMNLLYREKADLEDTPDAAKADIAQAEDWSNKSLDMRKIKAARPAKKETT
jgi:tetratricopeptide (TPR) repeat protein